MPGSTKTGWILAAGLWLAAAPMASANDGAEKAPPPGAQAKRAFVERSLVLLPEQAGAFRLTTANDYPGQPDLGVGARYVHPDFPAVRLDLFVYPIGRVDRDDALARVLSEVREGVEAGVQQGKYAHLEMGGEAPLDLGRVGDDGALAPEADAADPAADGVDVRAEDGSDLDVALEAISAGVDAKSDWRRGRRLDMRLDFQGVPQNSIAFAFYRGLYLYKGRISASPVDVPSESLDRLGQHAMATLLPAVQVRSTGACHEREITFDPDMPEDERAKDLFGKMARSLALAESESCAEVLDEGVPDGQRGFLLTFDPDVWRDAP